MPNARARGIISCPILPTPIRPSVRPKTTRFGKLFLVPRALSQGDDVVRDATIERENQGKSKLGNGDRIFARTIRNVDPAF